MPEQKPTYSREEFERDSKGQTGDELAARSAPPALDAESFARIRSEWAWAEPCAANGFQTNDIWRLIAEIDRLRAATRDAAPAAEVDRLREGLSAARDALVAFQKQASWIPLQQGYSTTLTEAERQLAAAVSAIDSILVARDAASAAESASELDDLLADLREEILRAQRKHAPMHSFHEGWAVIYEEFMHEMTPEAFKQRVDRGALETEAIHTAAMACRFVLDLLRPKQETESVARDAAGAAPLTFDWRVLSDDEMEGLNAATREYLRSIGFCKFTAPGPPASSESHDHS